MLTASEVHFAIQEINKTLPASENAIAISAIANKLCANATDLSAHIDTLACMHYLGFADRSKIKVVLTFNGRNTIVPH